MFFSENTSDGGKLRRATSLISCRQESENDDVQVVQTISETDEDVQDDDNASSIRIGLQPAAQAPSVANKKHLHRTNTMAPAEGTKSQRDSLVETVESSGALPVSIDEGQTGTVYVLEVGGEKIAVFKPESGERFSRSTLERGQGFVREEVVYLIDRFCGSHAKVPVTTKATVEVDGKKLVGSVQAFVADVAGFIEDYAIPRDPDEANDFLPKEAAEALALLDMHIFNMDRHSGNLLLLCKQRPHGLGPIDHGCCLPPWWKLAEANFDAWITWSHLNTKPSEATRKLALQADGCLQTRLPQIVEAGLEPDAVVTLTLCTRFVAVGVGELGIPCAQLAKLLLREDFEHLSWIERTVQICACEAGARCSIIKNNRDEQELSVEEQDNKSLDVNVFLKGVERKLRELGQELIANAGN